MMKLLRQICIFFLLWCGEQMVTAQLMLQPKHITTAQGLPSNYIYDIIQDKQGYIWIGGTGGLSRYDGYNILNYANIPSGGEIHSYTPSVRNLKTSDDGRFLWVNTTNFMFFCYDTQTGSFVDYTGRHDEQRTYREQEQGSQGMIWLYQDVNGLRRLKYDGTVFQATDYTKDQHKLPHVEVRQVNTTPDGGAWLSTDNGIAFVNPQGQVAIVDSGFKVRRCVEADGCYLFFTSRNEVLLADAHGQVRQTIAIPSPIGEINRVTGYVADGHQAQVFTNAGTLTIDVRKKTVESSSSWPDIAEGHYFGLHGQHHVVITRSGELFLLTRDGHTVLRQQLMTKEGIGWFGHTFHVASDSHGMIYFATLGNGLFVFVPETKELHHFSATDTEPILRINMLSGIMVDREDNLWVATLGAGVTYLTNSREVQGTYWAPQPHAQDMTVNSVRALYPMTNGRLFVGTNDRNNYTLDISSGHFELLPGLDGRVMSLMTDRYGHRWKGLENNGFFIDDQHYYKESSEHRVEFNTVEHLLQDSLGRIWIAARDYGLLVLPAAREYAGRLDYQTFLNANASQRVYAALRLNKDGRLWVATGNGLFMADSRQKTLTPDSFHSFNPQNSPLPSYNLMSLSMIGDKVWCGIQGGGAVCCSFNNDFTEMIGCKQFTVAQGLPSNNVLSIQPDKEGNIWLGTESGLAVIDATTENVRSYHFSQQIPKNLFLQDCSMLLRDGRLLFGTNGGLLVVKTTPSKAKDDSAIHSFVPVVTDLCIDGLSILVDSTYETIRQQLLEGRCIELDYDQNNLSLHFSMMQYVNVDAVSYQYYLEGYERDWLPMTSHPHADYGQLKPGKYTLHVKALVNNHWTEEQTLVIRVLPPWWRSWWAYLVYLCVFFGVAGLIGRQLWTNYQLRQHVKEERQRSEMERQLTDYKIRFFTNISHEFRTPLTIIRGMMERLKQLNKQGDLKQPLDTMKHSTDRMLRLINQLLEFRKMQQGKLSLSLREDDIVAYIQNIYMDFHESAEEKNIKYDFRAQMRSLRIPFDTSYIDKIFYNLISNAFKYTQRKGEVIVEMKKTDAEELQVVVKDNGIGVPEELRQHLFDRYMESSRVVKDSLGIGLTLTGELVRTHHGSISYEEREGGGSVFTVTLPASRLAYSDDEFMPDSVLNDQEEETVRRGFEQAYREMQANPLNEDVTILVVEDDGDVASYIAQTLAPYFHVETAGNGEEALSIISDKIQLVVSDVMMPQMDGYELTTRLRKSEQWRHIPIILLTALTDQDKYLKGITLGADLYLPKPFSPSVLVAHALQLVNQRGKVRQQATADMEQRQAEQPHVVVSDIRDKNFIQQLDRVIAQHLSDENLAVETLTDSLGIGRSKLFEKMKALMNMTPRDYILKRRMEYATELLMEGNLNIAEIAYKTGFGHPPYFTRVFKKYYGVTPSEYIKDKPKD